MISLLSLKIISAIVNLICILLTPIDAIIGFFITLIVSIATICDFINANVTFIDGFKEIVEKGKQNKGIL